MTRRTHAIVCAIVVAIFCATFTPQGRATRNVDRATADAIDAIDAAPGKALAERPSPGSRERIADWVGLLRFFAPGLLVAASIGASAGVLGTFVLLRREALIALAMPQVVAVGAAVGMRAGWPTLPPALVAVVAALLYFVAGRRRETAGARGTTFAAPAIYIAGLCGSFLIIAHGGQHVEELQNLFTGIDVAVTPGQAWFAAPLLLTAATLLASLWRRWLLIAQAPATAELNGRSVRASDALFLGLLSVVLLVGTSAQGAVMVLAMLFLPPTIVAPWVRRIPAALLAAVLAAWLCLALAFVTSVNQQWPLSHSIGGIAFAGVLISNVLRYVAERLFIARERA